MQDRTNLNIIGPDVNEFRGDIDYRLLATQTPYCYLRASSSGTGTFRVDRKFLEFVRGMRDVGILTGAYHYALPSADFTTADQQCDDFIALLQQGYGAGNYGDLFPVIDVEAPLDKSISTDTLLDWVDRFRKRFERRTRRKMMIYTGAFFIELYNNFYHTSKGFILSDMPLWIAMYVEIPVNPPYPRDAGGWTRWRMWQFTESGTIPGVNPPVDLNYGPTNLDFLTPPRPVRNLRAVPTKNSIKITWTPNTDVDLNGYNVFLNSNYAGSISKHASSHEIRLAQTPKANERYEVAMEAYDTDGDFSTTRAKTTVVFTGRYSDEREEDYDYDHLYQQYYEPEISYKDPVDLLEENFIRQKYRIDTSTENRQRYNDENIEINHKNSSKKYLMEWDNDNDEFDDIAFMNEIEYENIERSTREEPKYTMDFYDIHQDDDNEDEVYHKAIHQGDDREDEVYHKVMHQGDNREDEVYHKVINHGDGREDEVYHKAINQGDDREDEVYHKIIHEDSSYEGNRRRIENRDNMKNKSSKDKHKHYKCEYVEENMHPYWQELEYQWKKDCKYNKKEHKKHKNKKHHRY